MKVKWDVETNSGSFYQAGIYKVKIKEITEVEAKSGNQQLRIKTEIVEGAMRGKQLTEHITLVESCTWKLVKFIKAMGVDVSKLESVDTSSGAFRAILNKCYGRTVYFNVAVVKNLTGDKDINDIVDYQEDTDATWDNPVDEEPEFLKDG